MLCLISGNVTDGQVKMTGVLLGPEVRHGRLLRMMTLSAVKFLVGKTLAGVNIHLIIITTGSCVSLDGCIVVLAVGMSGGTVWTVKWNLGFTVSTSMCVVTVGKSSVLCPLSTVLGIAGIFPGLRGLRWRKLTSGGLGGCRAGW